MTDWWRSIEDELDARSVDAPDPWADLALAAPVALTDEQQRFLLALGDQPAVPHIDEHDAAAIAAELAADVEPGALHPETIDPDSIDDWDG